MAFPHDFADLEDRLPHDIDPEDDTVPFADSDDSAAEHDTTKGEDGRTHYQAVGKSKIRKEESVALGPRYDGSQVSRQEALEQESDYDPFRDQSEEEEGQGENNEVGGNWTSDSDNLISPKDRGGSALARDSDGFTEFDDGHGDTDNTSISGNDEHEVKTQDHDDQTQVDRAELRRIMKEEHHTVVASIAEATRADADKGNAVKRQRKTFDSLLNTRIRLQQGLVAVNSMQDIEAAIDCLATEPQKVVEAAEHAAIRLWNTLDDLRQTLVEVQVPGRKRQRLEASQSTPIDQYWEHMQSTETEAEPHRQNILKKWSLRTQAATTRPASRRLNNTARQPTITDVLADHLSNTTRLIKRAHIPRSCAPLQASRGVAETSDIFDDADFYGLLLKELLEQRSAEAASTAEVQQAAQQWRAAREARTKKDVDTRASKGRKMRYTVHEKLQNFMAPERTGSWGDKQRDELFGSLLGRRWVPEERGVDGNEGARHDEEEEALRLFRS